MPQFVAVLRRSDGLSRRPWGGTPVFHRGMGIRGRSAQPPFLPVNRDTCCQTPASDDVDMLKLKVDEVRMLVVASVS